MSIQTRASDETLELAGYSETAISWEKLLRDTQTQLSQYGPTRFKQSIYKARISETTMYSSPDRPLPIRDGRMEKNLLTGKQLRNFRTLTEQTVTEFHRYLLVVADPD
ncbi:hypothetical protein [Larkinella rosea]|uniref:Uncharacterized protein n=1 Tax=Larkinella rosea TaxID=2025312 RepID=A0A3P1BIP4_9BACT|nr:hypothetical protein [Larkinella rosea]RRB00987.1 hypothetical protein EHT25_22660 [Larkinella rosea]